MKKATLLLAAAAMMLASCAHKQCHCHYFEQYGERIAEYDITNDLSVDVCSQLTGTHLNEGGGIVSLNCQSW